MAVILVNRAAAITTAIVEKAKIVEVAISPHQQYCPAMLLSFDLYSEEFCNSHIPE